METLEPILKQHPFFKGLSKEYMKLITGCASNVVFKAGKYIVEEGGKASKFYLIRKGRVALEIYSPHQGPINIFTLSKGELLGFSWLFPPYKWNFGARVVEDTRALEIDGKCLREKCEDDHTLGYELQKRVARIMLQRLKAISFQLTDVYSNPSNPMRVH